MKIFYSSLLFLSYAASAFAHETVALENFEKHIYSQNGEDGVIEKIASLLTQVPQKWGGDFNGFLILRDL